MYGFLYELPVQGVKWNINIIPFNTKKPTSDNGIQNQVP